MPSVSVIVPVHNVAPYLENSVRSIMRQTLEDIEIILVENLSADSSPRICRELAAEDDRIRILTLDEAGLSIARNAGIDAAAADVVCFIDGDDTIEPDMLSAMSGAMTKYGADVAMCNYILDYPDKPSRYRYTETCQTRFFSSAEMLAEMFQEHVPNSACVMLFRKQLFKDTRFPVGRYFEDHAVTYLLVSHAENGCVYIGKSYYHYLQREGSICYTPDFKKSFDFASACLERLHFIHAWPGFSNEQKKVLMQNDIKLYIGNMIHAIKQVKTEEQKRQLEQLKTDGDTILSYNTAKGKRRLRLLRMKYLWKIFYRQHR